MSPIILTRPGQDLFITQHLETTLLESSLIMPLMSLKTFHRSPQLPKTKSKDFNLASELDLIRPSSTFKNLSPIPSHHQSYPLAKLTYLSLIRHTSLFVPCMHLLILFSPTRMPVLLISASHPQFYSSNPSQSEESKPIKELFLNDFMQKLFPHPHPPQLLITWIV